MEKYVSRGIQDVIDLVLAATQRAEGVKQLLNVQLASLGLAFEELDDDFVQLLSHLQYMKALAESYEDDVADNHGENGSHTA